MDGEGEAGPAQHGARGPVAQAGVRKDGRISQHTTSLHLVQRRLSPGAPREFLQQATPRRLVGACPLFPSGVPSPPPTG